MLPHPISRRISLSGILRVLKLVVTKATKVSIVSSDKTGGHSFAFVASKQLEARATVRVIDSLLGRMHVMVGSKLVVKHAGIDVNVASHLPVSEAICRHVFAELF